ncbi:hypothetical protein KSZ_35870 [Dictyobacter formicarum]|uniref:Uncharacterized protein n=1 Tax=Dictyobacter formicarum TaxID=2778368 RepID=A0ABQ3VIS8_9CHLR|nr:hypothetical protein KSZ_35870 [Dictyobacter formicarum]
MSLAGLLELLLNSELLISVYPYPPKYLQVLTGKVDNYGSTDQLTYHMPQTKNSERESPTMNE